MYSVNSYNEYEIMITEQRKNDFTRNTQGVLLQPMQNALTPQESMRCPAMFRFWFDGDVPWDRGLCCCCCSSTARCSASSAVHVAIGITHLYVAPRYRGEIAWGGI